MHPFAVLSGPNQTPVWAETLTARHVLCLGNCSLAVPTKTIVANAPDLMGVGATPEQAGLMTAKLVTGQLAGKNAIYGGDAVKNKKRVFGVTHYDTVDGQQKEAYATLKAALDKGGVKIAADLPFQLDLARGQENARTEIAKLKEAGVTTVIYTGDPLTPARPHQGGDGAELLPGMGDRLERARRHRGVRPHLRPGAVEARVRSRPHAGPSEPGRQPGATRSTSGSTADRRPTTRTA